MVELDSDSVSKFWQRLEFRSPQEQTDTIRVENELVLVRARSFSQIWQRQTNAALDGTSSESAERYGLQAALCSKAGLSFVF